MWNNTSNNTCSCERIMQIGHWEEVDRNGDLMNDGPRVQCEECGLQFILTWEQWERIPIENKAVVRAH